MSLVKTKVSLETEAEVLQAVAKAIALVQQQTGYGSIEVTVHEGRVTQIERREKVRFEHKVSTTKN
ncbi:MAG: YezD family protein [Methylotenera sp.]|nr:YezD family protein [Methylotenera sp.]